MKKTFSVTSGNQLRCRGWRQEALLRLLENVLAVGENPDELIVYAALGRAARDWPSHDAIVHRKAADMSGGFIASCRNPIPASYVREHAALGGISQALALGEVIIQASAKGGSAVIDAICNHTGGQIIGSGKVSANTLRYTDEAFDVGLVDVGQGQQLRRIHVMNEHMAVDDAQGQRLATYPDVITTLDMAGNPISAGQLKPGMEIVIFHMHHSQIPLSSSVTDPAVYPSVEKTLGIDLRSYLPAGAK